MTLAFYLARWLGSPWHTIRAYKGACAPAWVALGSDEELDAACHGERPRKWGSGTDRAGRERVVATAVEGQGEDGWEELGRRCWGEMESLRQEWEERLGGAGEV